MSINSQIEMSKASGTASAQIQEGRFLARAGAGTVAQATTTASATDVCVGVSASAAAGAGSDVRIYQPGQVARVQSNGNLDPANDSHVFLTNDGAGQAVAASAGDRIMALWLRGVDEDPAANEFITVLITDQSTLAS